jgi:uncharacterized membrane protein YeaQ/YmgE (transglycosylase-associated protein family)
MPPPVWRMPRAPGHAWRWSAPERARGLQSAEADPALGRPSTGLCQMDIVSLLVLLLVAAIAGALGQAIAGYSLGGCLVSSAVGLIGALIGAWVANALGLPELLAFDIGGWRFPVVYAVIGATLFALIVGLLTRRRVPP